MRGDDQQLQTGMFSYVALEDRIPADHPLCGVRKLVDTVLAAMSKEFDGLYWGAGPSYFGIEYTTGCPTLRDFRRVGTMLLGVPFLIFTMLSGRRFRAYATSRILSSAILGSFTTTGPDSL